MVLRHLGFGRASDRVREHDADETLSQLALAHVEGFTAVVAYARARHPQPGRSRLREERSVRQAARVDGRMDRLSPMSSPNSRVAGAPLTELGLGNHRRAISPQTGEVMEGTGVFVQRIGATSDVGSVRATVDGRK